MPKSLYTKVFFLSYDPQILESKGNKQSHHSSLSTTMDSSQLCTGPAVKLPSRGRHYLLITRQKAYLSDWRRVVGKQEKGGCAGLCFADVNIFWLSLFQLIDGAVQNICILHFLRDAGIWKATFQWKKRNKDIVKRNNSLVSFFVYLLLCTLLKGHNVLTQVLWIHVLKKNYFSST